jgi:hypothetical protein
LRIATALVPVEEDEELGERVLKLRMQGLTAYVEQRHLHGTVTICPELKIPNQKVTQK